MKKGIRKEQYKNYLAMMKKIESCDDDEALELVFDLADEMLMAKLLTKKGYIAIMHAIDDRGMQIVERTIRAERERILKEVDALFDSLR